MAVPLVILWPGVTRSGFVCDVPAISIDHFPTLLQLASASEIPFRTACRTE
jgi:hypothetical protein